MNRTLFKDFAMHRFKSRYDASRGIQVNRDRVKHILQNIKLEQKAQFTNAIKGYYNSEYK